MVASLCRIAYVTYLGDDIGGPDGDTYDQGGWDLATGGWLSDDVTGLPYWPPGYPILVGVHYALGGRHPYLVKLTQIVVIALATWLAFRIAERLSAGPVSLLVGVGMSISLVWLGLAHPLMYETWQALLLLVAIWCLLRAAPGWHPLSYVGAGAALGTAAVFQDKFLTLVVVLVGWILWVEKPWRRKLMAGLIVVSVAAVPIAGFALRNEAVYGTTIVLATNHGINVAIGTGPSATGGYVAAPELPETCRSVVHGRSRAAQDRALTTCSLRAIATEPIRFISLVPAKLARLWSPFTGPRFESVNWSHPFDPWRLLPEPLASSAFVVAIYALWGATGASLFVLGVLWWWRRIDRPSLALLLLPIVWLMVVHVVTFGDPRFRIPVLPLIWIFQAGGIWQAIEYAKSRRRKGKLTDLRTVRPTRA